MGQVAQWVDWSSVESGVGAIRERAPASHEERYEEISSQDGIQDFSQFGEDFEEFEPPTHPDARTASVRSHLVTAWVSPDVVTNPDDDDVPPTMRSPIGMVTLPPAPESGDLIIAQPLRLSSRPRPVLVTEAVQPVSSGVLAPPSEHAQSYVEAW